MGSRRDHGLCPRGHFGNFPECLRCRRIDQRVAAWSGYGQWCSWIRQQIRPRRGPGTSISMGQSAVRNSFHLRLVGNGVVANRDMVTR